MRLLRTACAIAAIACAASARTPLRVSANGHYLETRDGVPFLWTGDTAWAMFYKLNREEVVRYLDDRRAKGFNVILAVAYWYPHGEDGPGPHNAPNAYGHRPFTGGDDSPDTARPDVRKGGSPDAPNDYWDHADFIVREVRARGMFLALLPSWSRAFVNSTFETSRPTIDERTARVYGQFLSRRYRKEPHIIWVIGGDINPTKNGDRIAVYRAMAEAIGKAAGRDALMTYHPDGDPNAASSRFFHSDAWLDANGLQTWRSVDRVYSAVAHNYALQPAKPILFLEGAYERGRYPEPGGEITPLKVRRQAWQAMLAGAAGQTYGASSMWHFMRKPRRGMEAGEWIRALDYPAAAQVAGLLPRLLNQYKWWTLVPDPSLLLEGAGSADLTKAAARTSDGKRVLIYFADPSPATVKVPDGAKATWIRLDDGTREAAAAGPTFTPPAGWPDALLVLE